HRGEARVRAALPARRLRAPRRLPRLPLLRWLGRPRRRVRSRRGQVRRSAGARRRPSDLLVAGNPMPAGECKEYEMKVFTRIGLMLVVGVAVAACSNNPGNPIAPSAAGPGIASAVPEGSPTLKVTTPDGPLPAA